MAARSFSVLSVVVACTLSFLALSTSAIASTSYLRPDSDITLGPWSIVGATSGWASLDDNVLPTETPTAADYVTTAASGRLEVGLENAPLAGSSGVELSAWFYTPTADGVRMEIRTSRGDLLAKADVKSAGWHSVAFEQSATQYDLDSSFMRFERIGGSLPKVYAAFLRLTQTPSPTKLYWGSWIDGHVYTTNNEFEEEKEKGDAPWELSTWKRSRRMPEKRPRPSFISDSRPPGINCSARNPSKRPANVGRSR